MMIRATPARQAGGRRVISVDAPDVRGPKKTLYNRFVRWAIFHALALAALPRRS
jgi:hypothetical protein